MNQKINEELINLKEEFSKGEISINDVINKLFCSNDLTDFVYKSGLNTDWLDSEDIILYIDETQVSILLDDLIEANQWDVI